MTNKDLALIAQGFAETEAILETTGDPNGSRDDWLRALRLCQAQIAGSIAAVRPRFKRGQFEMDCLPLHHARHKAAILKALGK